MVRAMPRQFYLPSHGRLCPGLPAGEQPEVRVFGQDQSLSERRLLNGVIRSGIYRLQDGCRTIGSDVFLLKEANMTTKDIERPQTKQPAQTQTAPARRSSPFDLIQTEIDRVFDRFNGFNVWNWPGAAGGRIFSPHMQVVETEDAIEVTTELPGIDEKDVEISVADGVLTIRGEKKSETDETKKNYRLVERAYGSFERALALPAGVDAAKVDARMNKGVLKVVIPRPAAAKAQQVKITAE